MDNKQTILTVSAEDEQYLRTWRAVPVDRTTNSDSWKVLGEPVKRVESGTGTTYTGDPELAGKVFGRQPSPEEEHVKKTCQVGEEISRSFDNAEAAQRRSKSLLGL